MFAVRETITDLALSDIIKCQTQKPGGPDGHWNAAGKIMLLKMSTKTLGFLRHSKRSIRYLPQKAKLGVKMPIIVFYLN